MLIIFLIWKEEQLYINSLQEKVLKPKFKLLFSSKGRDGATHHNSSPWYACSVEEGIAFMEIKLKWKKEELRWESGDFIHSFHASGPDDRVINSFQSWIWHHIRKQIKVLIAWDENSRSWG